MKDDPTKFGEDIADEVLEEGDYVIHVLGPAIQNRPMFQTPKPKEVEHQEFAEMWNRAFAGDPTLLQQAYQGYEAVSGRDDARDQFLAWLIKHHKMIGAVPTHDVMEQNNAGSLY